jgi:hypothetical protein
VKDRTYYENLTRWSLVALALCATAMFATSVSAFAQNAPGAAVVALGLQQMVKYVRAIWCALVGTRLDTRFEGTFGTGQQLTLGLWAWSFFKQACWVGCAAWLGAHVWSSSLMLACNVIGWVYCLSLIVVTFFDVVEASGATN